MESIIKKFADLKNDQIGDGVYIAFEWSDKKLSRIYIGTKQCGPMLQYEAYNNDLYGKATGIELMGTTTIVEHGTYYNGIDHVTFLGGAWTNLYSRGNFGKKYAYGGNWSGHTKNLITPNWRHDDKQMDLLVIGDNFEELPTGIKGDIGMTDMDCSGSWTIFYNTADEAIKNRLPIAKIAKSNLPELTKIHLQKNETESLLEKVKEVIEIYNL